MIGTGISNGGVSGYPIYSGVSVVTPVTPVTPTAFRKYVNNFSTGVLGFVNANDTTITLNPNQTYKLGNLAPGEYYVGTLTDFSGANTEIVNVTGINGDTLTIIRGQEGTVPKTYSFGTANFSIRVTATAFQQVVNLEVNAKTFGATGNGSTDDTEALNNFFSVVSDGYIPPGNYKITGPLVFKSNQQIRGSGTATVINYVANSPAANSPVLSMGSLTNCDVRGLQLQVSPTSYPTARALYIGSSTDCSFRDIKMVGGGGNPGYLEYNNLCSIVNVEVDDYRSNGFMVVNGQDCVIDRVKIPNGSGGFMGVQIIYGDSNVVKNCYIAQTPDNYFGIHLYRTNTPDVFENDIHNTVREAIALDSGGFGGRITNNTCRWDTNLGIGDFGISVYGDDANNIVGDYLIDGNTIINSALSGIGIAGWCQRGRVTNNVLRDCAYAGSSGFTAGIKVYGYTTGAVADDTVVEGNTISRLFGGMTQGVVEVNEVGVCSRTIIRNNKTFGMTGTVYSVEGTGSLIALNDDDLQLHPFVPTVTSQTGTLGSASATLDYQKVGRFIYCLLNVSIPTNGTGNTAIQVTLPFVPTGGGLVGFEGVLTGKMCKAGISGSNQLSITNFDNTYPGANGTMFELSGVLRIN